ncbi:hypothetical protein OCA97_14170 [Bacillus cereus]|nr:hypothetical protein [Bacillus cereus]MCU5677302.1 hypothetical protein [Bacillus cereus]MED3355344.1 hypothetical protein [Bacillus thuringiensis]HDR4873508.1 hypothetical protein [Bacillus cereus]
MNQKKKAQLSVNIRKLMDSSENTSSDQIVRKGLALQIPSKRRFLFLMLFAIAFFTVYNSYFVKSEKVIEKFIDVLGYVNGVVVPIFAIIITGYAIFQALVNGSTLINLMTVSESDKSKFEVFNLYFLGISILYLILIILNLLLLIFFKNVPSNWSFPGLSKPCNEMIASILMTIYVTVLTHSLIELKSFVYNLFQCFTINAVSSGIDFLKKDNETDK